jgi:transcription-repair coupling factor (superfamily II helicase)
MRQDDWPSLFSELNAILQSLDLCDTKTIKKEATAS